MMNYLKSQKYSTSELLAKVMGFNPFKLQEEMLQIIKSLSGAESAI